MSEPVRVLHVLGGLGSGGTESLIINWYRNIDRSKVQFDFLVRSADNNYAEEILSLGGRIFYTPSFPRHFIRNYIETKKLLQSKQWEVIHVHGNAAMYMLPLKLAKKFGYACRIMHSHSVQPKNPVFSLVHFCNRKKISRYATHLLACSDAAGKWMYQDNSFQIIHNAVETDKFLFDKAARLAIRKELVIGDELVLGHVGRFSYPKNHSFLLDIFGEVKKQHPDSVLMLVGDGELREAVEEKARAMGIYDSVLFMGRRNDVGKLMSAMDIFVLPSHYEGLPVVCVESSINALTSIISEEAYVKELEALPFVNAFSLKSSAKDWAELVLNIYNRLGRVCESYTIAADSCYNIDNITNVLQGIYLDH